MGSMWLGGALRLVGKASQAGAAYLPIPVKPGRSAAGCVEHRAIGRQLRVRPDEPPGHWKSLAFLAR
jgi:hypothetical protein